MIKYIVCSKFTDFVNTIGILRLLVTGLKCIFLT